MPVIWFTKVDELFQFVNFHIKFHTIAAFLASALRLMHLTKQGDETEAGCVAVDQVRVSARAFKCLLEVTLRPIHSKLKGANAVHRTFDEHGIILSDRLLIYLGNDLNLIIKGCCTDEVRYRLIAILLLTLLKDSLLLRRETDVVEISPSLTIISLHNFKSLKCE